MCVARLREDGFRHCVAAALIWSALRLLAGAA
jgi:hypothetical protein